VTWARDVDRLFWKNVAERRQFFIDRGPKMDQEGHLGQLSASAFGSSAHAEIIKGAAKIFAALAHWLHGWSTLSHG